MAYKRWDLIPLNLEIKYLYKVLDFCLLLKTWANISPENTSKNLSGKYDQKLFDLAKQCTLDALKTTLTL